MFSFHLNNSRTFNFACNSRFYSFIFYNLKFFFNNSSLKTIENANFISKYFLFSTSIQCKFRIVEMRSINFIILLNYIYIICDKTLIATIARSHYIKKIVLKFLKKRIECLNFFFLKIKYFN